MECRRSSSISTTIDGSICSSHATWTGASDARFTAARGGQGIGNTVTPCTFPPISNILYRSNRDGTFTDVSRGTGISPLRGEHSVWLWAITTATAGSTCTRRQRRRPGLSSSGTSGGRSFAETGVAAGVAVDGNGRAVAGMGGFR